MDETLTLSGDQIGTYTGLVGSGGGGSRVVDLTGVQALGTSDDIYTVLVEQTNGADEFQNGQFITIFDSSGNEVMPRTGVQPDVEEGRASGDEHLIITSQQFVIDLGGVPAGPNASVTYTSADDSADPAEGDNDGSLDFSSFPVFPCLAAGTMVEASNGYLPVEDLRPGMKVVSEKGALRTVRWVAKRELDLSSTETDQRPISFAPGSLGPGLPRRELIVSPGHRMFLSGALPQALFGHVAVLPVARGLTTLPGIRVMEGKKSITYVSVLLDQHAVMKAEGVFTESFFPGEYGMRTLGREMQREVIALIPGYREKGHKAYGSPAHHLVRLQEGRKLGRLQRDRLKEMGDAAWDDLSSASLAKA